jgi:hypothetical protein
MIDPSLLSWWSNVDGRLAAHETEGNQDRDGQDGNVLERHMNLQ